MRLPAVLLAVLMVTAACGDGETTAAGGPGSPTGGGSAGPGDTRRYTVTTTVLESPDHGPQMCLGGLLESYPPQCGGPDVVGWNWEDVENEESAGGTTWGHYTLVGTWDGQRLTLTEPPGPPTPVEPRPSDFSTPCEPPQGGWAVVDPATATMDGQNAAIEYARAQPDFAGAWVDQSINPAYGQDRRRVDEGALNDPTKLVLNLRFTGDVARHEADVRARWGGPLCVTEAEHTLAELQAIQQELHQEMDALTSWVDEVSGVVEMTVVVADDDLRQSLDARYGPGVVSVTGVLQPLR